MSEPFIGADGYYAVHVMWLDPITADQNKDSFTARYMDNKRDKRMGSAVGQQLGSYMRHDRQWPLRKTGGS